MSPTPVDVARNLAGRITIHELVSLADDVAELAVSVKVLAVEIKRAASRDGQGGRKITGAERERIRGALAELVQAAGELAAELAADLATPS